MIIITSEECTEYSSPGHPECPERIKLTLQYLKEKNYKFIDAKPCTEEEILLVHSKRLLEQVRSGNFFEPDTPSIKNILHYARISAGAAILAMEYAVNGEPAFSLTRPPGHHASTENLGGFCYFNNIAIAVKKYMQRNNKRVAILDIDCHHGNGTEEIFFGNENVLFISLHQYPLYPGTGRISRKNCLNFPFPPNTSEKEYLLILKKALDEIEKYKPDLLALSVGFDTYKGDPLTQTSLDIESYYKISKMISELGINRFAVLEGGYSKDLPQCVWQFLEGF